MKCVLFTLVRATDGHASIQKEVDIPFPPYAGLEMSGLTKEGGNLFILEVQSVWWDAKDSIMHVHLKNDEELTEESLREKLNDYGDGWRPQD